MSTPTIGQLVVPELQPQKPWSDPKSMVWDRLPYFLMLFISLWTVWGQFNEWFTLRRQAGWPLLQCRVHVSDLGRKVSPHSVRPLLLCPVANGGHAFVQLQTEIRAEDPADLKQLAQENYPVGETVNGYVSLKDNRAVLGASIPAKQWGSFFRVLWFLCVSFGLVMLLRREYRKFPAPSLPSHIRKGEALLKQQPHGCHLLNWTPPNLETYRSPEQPAVLRAQIAYFRCVDSTPWFSLLMLVVFCSLLFSLLTMPDGNWLMRVMFGLPFALSARASLVYAFYRARINLGAQELEGRCSAFWGMSTLTVARRQIREVRLTVTSSDPPRWRLVIASKSSEELGLLAGEGRPHAEWLGRMIALWAACPFVDPDGGDGSDSE